MPVLLLPQLPPWPIPYIYAAVPMFVQDVQDAERRKETDTSVDENYALKVLTDYITSVGIFTALVRKWLPEYKGYECKEAEAGKLTLAFWDIDDAVR